MIMSSGQEEILQMIATNDFGARIGFVCLLKRRVERIQFSE